MCRGIAVRRRTGGGAVFFTAPDAFRTERSFSTDLSAHYRYRVPHAASAEVFVKADVLNVFNRHAVVNSQYLNLAVPTNVSAPDTYSPFNPFTTRPAQGVNWDLGPSFGEPSSGSPISHRGRSACRWACASDRRFARDWALNALLSSTGASAAVASFLPARRATRFDPASTLREG